MATPGCCSANVDTHKPLNKAVNTATPHVVCVCVCVCGPQSRGHVLTTFRLGRDTHTVILYSAFSSFSHTAENFKFWSRKKKSFFFYHRLFNIIICIQIPKKKLKKKLIIYTTASYFQTSVKKQISAALRHAACQICQRTNRKPRQVSKAWTEHSPLSICDKSLNPNQFNGSFLEPSPAVLLSEGVCWCDCIMIMKLGPEKPVSVTEWSPEGFCLHPHSSQPW